jgi:hypothetical protein
MNYNELPSIEQIQKTILAVKARGVNVEYVEAKEAAHARLQALIPAGVSIYYGASVTLEQIGFIDLLKSGSHPWRNLKAEMLAEKDPLKQSSLRKHGTLADYYLGSVHAIAETGELVFASATGSQLGPYAYSSGNIIWVAGVQKITPSLEAAIRRVREYSLSKEDEHVKSLGNNIGSFIGKLMIFEREAPYLHRNLTLLLVNKVLGF